MNKIIAVALSVLSIAGLSGCVGDSKMSNGSTNEPRVTINNPPPQVQSVDTSKLESKMDKVTSDLRQEIATSTNNTQTHMNGLVDANINKLGEQVTGMENNIKEAIGLKAEMHNTATADIKAKLEATMNNTADIKTSLNNTMTATADIRARIDAQIAVNNDMKVQLDRMNAQVGINNKLDQIDQKVTQGANNSNAGHDINAMPRQTVVLILGIFSGFFSLLTLVVAWLGKNARQREALRTEEAMANTERWQAVAMQAISRLEPDKSKDIIFPPAQKRGQA